ncbi:MAG: ATP-dependent Clp protease proteolytic subunit [Silvanigrellales bacterium]|nr:ATP-dependent Clp protease proteolytic subunit [Silvanigrellales bacterium]
MSNTDDLSALLEGNAQRTLFKSRKMILSEGVNGQTARKVIEQLLALEADDPTKDIWLFLNSPGGEVNSGFGIFDTMRFIKPEVKVIVSGLAASIATVILLGAKKEFRFAMPNARLLIHQPLIGGHVQGQATDIEITAREMLKTREKIAVLYNKETGQPLERIERDIERDYWMTSDEAKEYGLISRVISSWNEVL